MYKIVLGFSLPEICKAATLSKNFLSLSSCDLHTFFVRLLSWLQNGLVLCGAWRGCSAKKIRKWGVLACWHIHLKRWRPYFYIIIFSAQIAKAFGRLNTYFMVFILSKYSAACSGMFLTLFLGLDYSVFYFQYYYDKKFNEILKKIINRASPRSGCKKTRFWERPCDR